MKNKKIVAVICCLALLVGAAGATLAWLMDKTDEVTNTFTTSDINVELTESDSDDEDTNAKLNSYQMVPGFTIDKDPVVTVKADSEDCWVFIKVNKEGKAVVGNTTYNFDDFIKYDIDKNWTELEETEGETVYYCYAKDITADRNIKVLGYEDDGTFYNNKVLVKDTVTKEMMDALGAEGAVLPNLTFEAYAVQYWKSNDIAFTSEEAWNIAQGLNADGTTPSTN